MRMWKINPGLMCSRHLLGEHVEMHMFAGCLNKNKSIEGYIKKGLVETALIKMRHDVLAAEMKLRDFRHNSVLNLKSEKCRRRGRVNVRVNEKELARRCRECGKRLGK